MSSRICSLAFILLVTLAGSACDSNDAFEIGGTYSGVTNSTLGTATLTVAIPGTSSGGTFSFTGTLVETDENGQPASTSTLRGTGTYDHPAVSLTVDGDPISGTVNEAGDRLTLDDDTGLGAFVLVRQ